MIRRLKHHEINFSKYNTCLANSCQQNFYARQEILDHLSPRWELLIYGNYEYVMPVPVVRKYSIKWAVMPLFCQQLGVSGPKPNPEIELLFFKALKEKFRIVYYAFHHSNHILDLESKRNYSIPAGDYNQIRKLYYKGRKSAVKKAQHLCFKEVKLSQALPFIELNFKGLAKQKDKLKLKKYLHYLQNISLLRTVAALHEDKIIAAATLVVTADTVFLLSLMDSEEHRKHNGSAFIIDMLLQQYSATHTFNFMGSVLPGVESFFKSFRPVCQPYPVLRYTKKELLLNLLLKR